MRSRSAILTRLAPSTAWFVFAGCSLMCCAATSHSQTINFDNVPDGTVINTRYAGMRFATLANGVRGDAYARASSQAKSPANVVTVVAPSSSVLPFFDRRQGGVEVTFDSPTSSASIDACTVLPPEYLGTPKNQPFLQAFDAQGGFIGVVYYPISFGAAGYGTWQTLRITATTAKIKSVQFSCQNGNGGVPVYGLFDNLVVGSAVDYTKSVLLKLTGPVIRRVGNRVVKVYVLAITNRGIRPIPSPLQVWQTVPTVRLGSTIANPTGTRSGTPYRTYLTSVPVLGTVSVDLPLTGAPSSAFVPGLRICSGLF